MSEEVTKEQVEEALIYAEHLEQERDFYGRIGMNQAVKDAYAESDRLEAIYNVTHEEKFR